ncbi:MAG: hypothetical protein HY328_04305 [Chloroflexi bacterium]|nr:hypothetical protein [Chloroflexota bacterium]
MTLDEILQDIHALEEDLNMYERKYGVLSETFYDAYMQGEEPPEAAWVADWNDWAGVHEIWLDRRQRYQTVIALLQKQTNLIDLIQRAAHRESIPLPA